MKKISILPMIALFAIILSSCGGGSKEFTVKNNSVNFAGDLQGYLEVVDGKCIIRLIAQRNDESIEMIWRGAVYFGGIY